VRITCAGAVSANANSATADRKKSVRFMAGVPKGL